MNVFKTRKVRTCHCCGAKLPRGAWVSSIDDKIFRLYHGKIYRLHAESIRWIRDNFL